MATFLDLLSGQEELRHTSALAFLLHLERKKPRLLGALLRCARHNSASGGTPKEVLGDNFGDITDVRVEVEEPCGGRSHDGRFDLTIRYTLDGKPHLLAVEVKVAAAGEHRSQIRTYWEQIEEWRKEEPEDSYKANATLGLLLSYDLDKFGWADEHRDRPHVRCWWRWEDVRDAIREVLEGRPSGRDAAFRELAAEFLVYLEDFTMSIEDYRKALGRAGRLPPYPLVVDAMELLARKLAADQRLQREPVGTEGAPWDDEEKAYWCGYWWWLPDGDRWSSLTLSYSWKEGSGRPPGGPNGNWIGVTDGSGYLANVEFRRGRRGGGDGESLQVWSLERFVEILTDEGIMELQDLVR
ncbi:MAG: hypothetical protein O7H41_20780 [Planctomycetota bacterium]|nr:hypothetical protein [Planctomycetota bacterium]